MASTGNAAANAHFEARLADPVLNPANGGGGLNPGAFRRPGRDSPEMAAFIRLKYVDKRCAPFAGRHLCNGGINDLVVVQLCRAAAVWAAALLTAA